VVEDDVVSPPRKGGKWKVKMKMTVPITIVRHGFYILICKTCHNYHVTTRGEKRKVKTAKRKEKREK
jgi:hypothetical protein